jgi:hypothetical protein
MHLAAGVWARLRPNTVPPACSYHGKCESCRGWSRLQDGRHHPGKDCFDTISQKMARNDNKAGTPSATHQTKSLS